MSSLQTGIQALDRQLDGGFPGGTLIALVTQPDSPSSRVLHQLMKQRPTTYITTLRSSAELEAELMRVGNGTMDVDIEEIGEVRGKNEMLHQLSESNIYSADITEQGRRLDEVYEIIDSVTGSQNVIIDPMNPLESSEQKVAYQRFLRMTATKLRDVNGLGVFHCLSQEGPPTLRNQTLTIVDTVWNLEMGTDNEGNLSLKMTIPKNRGGAPIFEKLTLLIDKNSVRTDISRGI